MQEKFSYWWILLMFVCLFVCVGFLVGFFVGFWGLFVFLFLIHFTHAEVMGKIGAAVAGLLLGQC